MSSGAMNSNEEEDRGEEEQDDDQSNQDGKDSDSKATATLSKHSARERIRRTKIKERYQRLRDLIPHPSSEEKKDKASFILEVIEYVQYLQGEVQKYKGINPPSSSVPTKLTPWKTSHWRWRTQGTAPQPLENADGNTENGYDTTQFMLLGDQLESSELDALFYPTDNTTDQHPDLANLAMSMDMPTQTLLPPIDIDNDNNNSLSNHLPQQFSDSQTVGPYPSLAAETLSQPDGLAIGGGTISISSAYSQGLLNTLTDALQRAGVDLSQANISVQIDLVKQANKRPAAAQDHSNPPSTHPPPSTSVEDSDQAQKRPKT